MALALPVNRFKQNRIAAFALLRHMNGLLMVALIVPRSMLLSVANVLIIDFMMETVLVASRLLLRNNAIIVQDSNLLMEAVFNA